MRPGILICMASRRRSSYTELYPERVGFRTRDFRVQGYLPQKKPPPPRTLQKDHAYGPMVVLGGGAISYERSDFTHGVVSPEGGVPVWGYNPV